MLFFSDKNLIRIYTARPNRAALSARIFSGKTYVCHRSKPLAVIIFGVSIVAAFFRMDGILGPLLELAELPSSRGGEG